MKKRLALVLSAIILSSQMGIVAPLSVGAEATTYYVSALDGDDQNSGTDENAPFKTISRATKSMKAGDTCIIKAGVYREAADMNVFGTEDARVTYRAADGAEVIVTTADLLTDWSEDTTLSGGKIYKATMDWNVDSGRGNMLFDDEVLKREATYPDISNFLDPDEYAYIQPNELNFDYNAATLTHADIPDDVDLTGAVISYDTEGGYWNYTSPIATYDGSSIITFNTSSVGTALQPAVGNKFFITRAKGLINEPGEWYKDEANDTIYYMTDGTAPSGVAAKKRENTLLMDKAKYVVVKGITLQGGAPLTSDLTNNCTWDGITVENMDYQIYDDRSVRPGATGFTVLGSYNTVQDSDIGNNFGCGINVEGHHNRIINNNIHDVDWQHNYSHGVVVNGEKNLVSYNSIHDVGRTAIGGNPQNCEISYNDLHDGMKISADGGLIYLMGDLNYTRIHHNLIHSPSVVTPGLKVGLYYDSTATKIITYNNVIYDIPQATQTTPTRALFMNSPNVNNLFVNNTIMNSNTTITDGDKSVDYSLVANEVSGSTKATMQGVTFINNLFNGEPFTTNILDNQGIDYQANNVDGETVSLNGTKPVADKTLAYGEAVSGITAGTYVGAYDEGTDWLAGKQNTVPDVKYEENTTIPFKNVATNYGFEKDFEGYTIETGDPKIMNHSSWSFNKLFTFTGDKSLALENNDSVSYKATGLKPNTDYVVEMFTIIRGMLLQPKDVDVESKEDFSKNAGGTTNVITNINSGDYIGYEGVVFNKKYDSMTLHLLGPANGTKIDIKVGSSYADSTTIATYENDSTSDWNRFYDRYWMPYYPTANGISNVDGEKNIYIVFTNVPEDADKLTFGGLELHNSVTANDVIELTAISDNGHAEKYESKYKLETNQYRLGETIPSWGSKPEAVTITTGSLGEIDIYLKKSEGNNIGYVDLLAIRDTSLDSVRDVVVGNAKIVEFVDKQFNEVISLGNSTVNIVEFEAQNNLKDAIECSFTAIGYKADGTEASKSIIDVTMKPFEKRTIGVGVNIQNIPGGYIELTTQKEGEDTITSVLANIFAVNQREATEGVVIDKVWLSDTLQKVEVETNKTFNAMIKNTTDADKKIACIVAFYGDNNRLLFAGKEEKDLKAGEINTFTKNIDVPAGCTYAKMFAWDITEGANGATQIAADIALGL